MVDFAKLTEVNRKRDKAFEVWREGAFPGRDWSDRQPAERDIVRLAWNRGFGAGYALKDD